MTSGGLLRIQTVTYMDQAAPGQTPASNGYFPRKNTNCPPLVTGS